MNHVSNLKFIFDIIIILTVLFTNWLIVIEIKLNLPVMFKHNTT